MPSAIAWAERPCGRVACGRWLKVWVALVPARAPANERFPNPHVQGAELALACFSTSRGGGQPAVWALEDPLTAPTLTVRLLTVPNPVDRCDADENLAVQPGKAPPLWTGSSSSNSVYRSGSIWTTAVVCVNYGSGKSIAIRWFQIDVSGWPDSVRILQDSIFGTDGTYHFLPTVMADDSDNLVIAYGQSSADEFASLYYTGRLATDIPNTLHQGTLIRAGEASGVFFHAFTSNGTLLNRYADYFGAALDPVDGSVWMIGQYAKGSLGYDERFGGDAIGVGLWVANVGFAESATE